MPPFRINTKSSFEQFKKAVIKGDTEKAMKAMKSSSFEPLNPYKCSKWELKWSLVKDDICPIHFICCKGNRKILHMFLDEYEDAIGNTTKTGLTTIHFAVYHSKYEILEVLISRGVDVDAKEVTRGNTALHLAVDKRNMGAVKRLLDDGLADINIVNNDGVTPKEVAIKMNCKTIIKHFQAYEDKVKFEQDMRRMATEQLRQASAQENLLKRNSNLEERVESIRTEVGQGIREDMRAEVKRLVQEELASVRQEHVTPAKKVTAPPIPPRNRKKSYPSNLSLASSKTTPDSGNTLTGADWSGAPSSSTQKIKDKIDWWTNQSTSKTSLIPDDTFDFQAGNPPASGTETRGTGNLSESRQRLMSSPFGSHLDLNLTTGITESDHTSGFGSHHDILEEEDVLSPLARYQITSNLPQLIYYIRYERIKADLFSKNILTPFDIETLDSKSVNHDQIAYILNNIILKGDNKMLRLFLEALEDNNYVVHAKKIRHTGALGLYKDRQEQQFLSRESRQLRAKSTPICSPAEFRIAVESNDLQPDEC